VQVPLDEVGVLGRGSIEVGEDHAPGLQGGVEMSDHHVGVVLDLQAGSLSDLTGRLEDLARHAVEVLSTSAGRVRSEVEGKLREVRVPPLLGLLRGRGQGLELTERGRAKVASEPGHLGQARQSTLVEGRVGAGFGCHT